MIQALKVVDKSRKDFSNIKKRLDQEIKIQKELDHPNIIRLYKNFDDESNQYLIMELGKDGDLKNFLNNYKPLSENQILDFSYQLACGIKYLHDKDIVHRDIKLCNVLISNGIIKIADFGLATKVTDDNPQCNTICGTANYLSPEILSCEGYGKKTDIWSFGCIFYALCTGSLPFFSGNPMSTIQNIKEGKWQLPSNISDYARDLLTNTLNWDQNSRLTIEQVLSHKFYDRKHQQNLIFFNNDECGNIQSNKLMTPTKTLLDWTSPRFNAPIFIPQKSQSSQKKNKKMHDLKSQKSLTSIKLDLNQYNKENSSIASNEMKSNQIKGQQQNVKYDQQQILNNKPFSNNQKQTNLTNVKQLNVSQSKQSNISNSNQQNNTNKNDDNKNSQLKKSSLYSQNSQSIMGMSNIFLTTSRSIHLGENSINLSNYQDISMNQKLNQNIEQQKNNNNPTQKLENYFQQNGNQQSIQQFKPSESQNSSNIRNKVDQVNSNNTSRLTSNRSHQNLKQNIEQPQNFNNNNNNQSQYNQNSKNLSLSNNQFTQSQQQINKDQNINQQSPYMSQNVNDQKNKGQILKSYRSASSLHQNYQSNDKNQSQKNPLQQTKYGNSNSYLSQQQSENNIPKQQNQQIQKDLSRLPLHNIKKPLQYFSQQQQQQEYENIGFTQSQSQNCYKQQQQLKQQNREDSSNNPKKYSSLSTVTKPLNKQDESYIHNYQQNRHNQQNVEQPKLQKVSSLTKEQYFNDQQRYFNDQKYQYNYLQHVNDQQFSRNEKQFIENNQQFNLQQTNRNIYPNQINQKANNQMKRNCSQQILPKDNQETNNQYQQMSKNINQTTQIMTKNDNSNLASTKRSQQDTSNNENTQIRNKNVRSLSNNIISNGHKRDNLELDLLTTDRQLSGMLRDQSERNLNFVSSPTQIQPRNNSKSFSQSVNGVVATSKERKVPFVAQSADFQEQIAKHTQLMTKQSNLIGQVDSKRSHQSDRQSGYPLSPLSTQGLKANKVSTKNGFIEIQENNWLSIECQNGQLIFKISPDGEKIQIQKFQKNKYQKKDYQLSSLPEKYVKLYNYAKVVCETLKAKTPLVKISNEKGTFMLMSNQPKQNYEVQLSSGLKVTHVIGTDTMLVKDGTNNEYTVHLIQQKQNQNIPQEITVAVKVSLEFMSICLQKQNEKYLANFK